MNVPLSESAWIVRLLDSSPAERANLVERACRDHPELRERLLEVVAAFASASSRPHPGADAERIRALELAFVRVEESATIAGRYKLLEKLGEGGFGVVWMAEQREPVRRRVAVKIIKNGMDSREVIARFEAERQALAMMDHPNIARVFDGGETEDGRPFFVMELVRGVPITRYCDNQQLPTEARLRLFVTVCHAVQHAHQKGVIHRDLKPSNILVTLHDGVAVPKIIDFGIAKATEARLTDKTLFTQLHAFLGTPAYTSPEQMEMSGLDVDTRSDIYSLGVLLYELLTGRPPFDPETLQKSGLEAMRRTIREVDPPRPSARLGTLSEVDRATIARQRSTDQGKLSVLLRGDLDWIVMRCIEKDRTRRYATANGLAADVQRHLASEPVTARPPSNAYRLQTFVRRHRLGFAAAAAVTGALVAGLIAASVLLVRERAAHHRAALAEIQEANLRQQAEIARADEVKRAARTALDLANRSLADGRVADGLAYLVYSARKDPLNRTLGPRLASVLASYNFAIPPAAPSTLGSRVLALRFTQDGRSFYVGTEDGTLRVMDAQTGALQRQLSVGRAVVSAGWEFARLNDGVVGARFPDHTFVLHDIATGAARVALRLPAGVGLPDAEWVAGLSPRGRWIYAVALREFWLWHAESGALQLHLKLPQPIAGRDFSPSEDTLAMIVGHVVERWSLPDGQRLESPIRFRSESPNPRPGQAEVHFSPDGKRLAVAERETVHIFDAATGTLTHQRTVQSLINSSTAFATNDRLRLRSRTQFGWWDLATDEFTSVSPPQLSTYTLDVAGQRGSALAFDGRLLVFDVGSDSRVVEPAWRQHQGGFTAISPDGARLLLGTADGLLYRFDVGRGAARPLVLPRPPGQPLPASFLPDSPARLLMLGRDHAKVVQVATGHEVGGGFLYPEPLLPHGMPDAHPPIRSDSKFMVVRTESQGWQSWELGSAGVTRVVRLQEAVDSPHLVTFSPMGDLVALSALDAPRVWNLRSGAPVGPPLTHTSMVVSHSLCFHPDARRLAVGGLDGSALVFDLSTGQPVLSLDTPRHVRIHAMRFSPDGERILTANLDGENRLWNAVTGQPIGPVVHTVGSSAFPSLSPDGRWAAVRNPKRTIVLDGRTGATVGNPIPAGSRLLRFSADSARLATADVYGTAPDYGNAQVWDLPGGDAVTEPMQHPSPGPNAPEFSPDGRFLKTETSRNIYVWAVPPALPEGAPPPEWLLQLATLCASQVVNDAGQLVSAPEVVAGVPRLRHEIATLPADAPLADWGRWVLDDLPSRPIAPGFTITPAEADALVAMSAATSTSSP